MKPDPTALPTAQELAGRVRTLLADNERLFLKATSLEDRLEKYESSPPDVFELGKQAGLAARDEEIETLKRRIVALEAQRSAEVDRRINWRNEAARLYGALKHARHVVRFAKKPSAWPKLDEFLHRHAVRYKEVRRKVEPQFEGKIR